MALFGKKVIYRERQLRGTKPRRNAVMRDILKKDTHHVLNKISERKEVFDELKKYGKHGLTKKELKKIFYHKKWKTLNKKEQRILREELGYDHNVRKIAKYAAQYRKDNQKKQTSAVSHAKHEVDFLSPHAPRVHRYGLRRKTRDQSLRMDTKGLHQHMAPTPAESYLHMQYRHTR